MGYYYRSEVPENSYDINKEGLIVYSETMNIGGYPVAPPNKKFITRLHSREVFTKNGKRMVGWKPVRHGGVFVKILLED